jgi:hypothetical protein
MAIGATWSFTGPLMTVESWRFADLHHCGVQSLRPGKLLRASWMAARAGTA